MRANQLKTVLTFIFYLCFNTISFGQIQKIITGKVVDASSSQGLEFANVTLLNSIDSTFVAGGVTDNNGVFSLTTSQLLDSKILRIQFLGYNPTVLKVVSDDMGEILLSTNQITLSEIQVTAPAKTFQMENGGITANVQTSRLKDMGSLSDVLGQLPFVVKDQSSYTVIGKGSPIFYINNRLVRNSLELEQISSKDVKKVTVITSPGVEYDASVNAVIKIETIRPVGEGLSGDAFTYNRYNRKFSTLNNIVLNYRKQNFDLFGRFGYADMSFPKDRKKVYTILENNSLTSIKTDSKENDYFRHIIPQVGFNYLIDKNHSVGSRYEFYNQPSNGGDNGQNIEVLKKNSLESKLHSDKIYDGSTKNHYVNIYYSGVLSKWLTMKIDIDYKTTKNKYGSNIYNLLESGDIEKVQTYNTASSDLYAAKLVLTTPIWGGNLVYGGEISHTKNQQDSYVLENMGAPGVVPSNNNVKQNLIAGFISYGRSFNRFSGDIGFRIENTSSDYKEDGRKIDEQSKDYKHFSPNIRVAYKHDKFQTELSYRNTIRRPSYSDLRSGIYYIAPYSYFSGNPFLQPTYQQSFNLMFMWKDFTHMTTYSLYKDRFDEMVPLLYLENSILMKPVNFRRSRQLSTSINYAPTVGIWKPNIEARMEKGFLKYGNPQTKYNKPIYSTSFRNNIQFKGYQYGVDINTRTKGHRGVEYLEKFSWNTSIYINKSFLNNSLSINITANDIFNTTKDIGSITAGDLSMYSDNSMYRRSIQFRVSYRFNTSKNRYKGSKASDEIDRL